MTDSERAELVRSLVRRWRTSVLIMLVAAGCGFGYGMLTPHTYTAQAFLVAVPQVPGDTTSATAFATAYSRLATQPAVLASAATDSGIPADTLRKAVSAAISPDAPVISITGSAHDATAAASDANAVAAALSELSVAHVTDTSVKLTLLAAAQPPTDPSSPSISLDTGLGAAAGVLLASLAALVGSGTAGRRREPEAAAVASVPIPAQPEPEPVESESESTQEAETEAEAKVEAQPETNGIAPVNEHSAT